MKSKTKLLIIFVIVIITLIILFGFIKVDKIILKKIYPLKYTEYVNIYAEKYNIDQYLIYAIIKAESNFKSEIVSSKRSNRINAINGNNCRRTC